MINNIILKLRLSQIANLLAVIVVSFFFLNRTLKQQWPLENLQVSLLEFSVELIQKITKAAKDSGNDFFVSLFVDYITPQVGPWLALLICAVILYILFLITASITNYIVNAVVNNVFGNNFEHITLDADIRFGHGGIGVDTKGMVYKENSNNTLTRTGSPYGLDDDSSEENELKWDGNDYIKTRKVREVPILKDTFKNHQYGDLKEYYSFKFQSSSILWLYLVLGAIIIGTA